MAYTAADVPAIFDLWINGQGYRFDQSYDDSPFRKAPAEYSYTSTFLERTNVGGAYGDDAQSFFLTVSQNDWSLGEGQRFFHSSDSASVRRYRKGSGIYITNEGQVSLNQAVASQSTTGTPIAACSQGVGLDADGNAYASNTNLYTVDLNTNITDRGAHGAGNVNRWGLCADGNNIYVAGATKIRKWNGAAFADFSASANAGSIAFLNNALYSCDGSTLNVYSTAGVKTVLFTWQDGVGAARTALQQTPKVIPYGGTLLIYWPCFIDRPEMWQYDGNNTRRIATMPVGSFGYDIFETQGVVFLSGVITDQPDPTVVSAGVTPVMWTYLNGNVDELWRGDKSNGITIQLLPSYMPAIASYSNNAVFTDYMQGRIMQYDLATGAISELGVYTAVSAAAQMSSSAAVLVLTSSGSTTGYFYPNYSAYASPAYIQTSDFDFDNSLFKRFRGAKIDFLPGSGTSSLDISYSVDDAAFVSLQTNATSGTEYTLASVTGKRIAIKVTLNWTSGTMPVLKRIYVRAAPILTSFKNNVYILDCSGNKAAPQPGYLKLGNDFTHDKDGLEMIADLQAAIAAGIISITDRFGTFNGIIEPGATQFKEVKSGYGRAEYRVELAVREV